MRILSGLLALTLLVACGADGAPLRPTAPGTTPDVTFTGQASLGVRL